MVEPVEMNAAGNGDGSTTEKAVGVRTVPRSRLLRGGYGRLRTTELIGVRL